MLGMILSKSKKLNVLHLIFLCLFFTEWACSSINSNEKSNRPKRRGENIFVKGKTLVNGYTCVNDRDHDWDFNTMDELFIVKYKNLYGIANKKKQIVLPIEYDDIVRPHLEEYFILTKKHLMGVVTKEGYLNIPIEYEHLEFEWSHLEEGEEDHFIVQKNQKIGSIDFYNNVIIPIAFDGISNWVEYGPDGHYVKKDSLYGLVDWNSGKAIIPVKYDGLYVCSENLVEIKKDGHYGVITQKNKVIVPCIYDGIFFDYWGMILDHKDFFVAKKAGEWYEYQLDGKLKRSNVPTKDIDKDYLKYQPDSFEYYYHLKECMVFPIK